MNQAQRKRIWSKSKIKKMKMEMKWMNRASEDKRKKSSNNWPKNS
jgi:hypothetical protein